MSRISSGLHFGRVRRLAEPVEIIAGCLGQFVEFGQQLLGSSELDMQVPVFQYDPRGQTGHHPVVVEGPGNLHPGGSVIALKLIDCADQTLLAAFLALEFFPFDETSQMTDQEPPVDQEGPAGLIAAEAVQQFDRSPTVQSEHPFDDRSVHYRNIEYLELLDDLGKVQ